MSDFCRVPEQALAEAASNLCRWPDADVPWTLQALLPGFTESRMVELLQPYFSKWDRVRVRYVQSASQARVLVGCRVIDGQNGVLADCFLPCGNNVRQVKLQFDMGENWTHEFLGQVAWHEFGHAIGISHAQPGSANIMAPSLNMAIQHLGQFDRAEQAKRYIEIIVPIPIPVPDPIPSPPTGGGILGGLFEIIAFFKKIAPILDLLKDPQFLKLIDLILALFAGKQALAAEDLDLLSASVQAQAQQLRSP